MIPDDPLYGVLIGTGVAGYVLFHLVDNARFKRRYFRWYVCFGALVILGFFIARGYPIALVLTVSAIVAFSVYVALATTAFCDACGKTVTVPGRLDRPGFCIGCGAPLQQRPMCQRCEPLFTKSWRGTATFCSSCGAALRGSESAR